MIWNLYAIKIIISFFQTLPFISLLSLFISFAKKDILKLEFEHFFWIQMAPSMSKQKPIMEEMLWKFPHISNQIFKKLSNKNLVKSQKIARTWKFFSTIRDFTNKESNTKFFKRTKMPMVAHLFTMQLKMVIFWSVSSL